jgi:hypothetical protein
VAIRPGLLNRLERRLEEQELAEFVEKARRAHVRHGLPFDAEARAAVEAFYRHKRTWPTGLDLEQYIQRAAAWWAPRIDVSVEEHIAEAERVAAECEHGCFDES